MEQEQTAQANESKYVTFKLDAETYALPIDRVREVLEFTTVTKVPHTPPFVRGVINLRGRVLPLVDMRLNFRLGETAKTAKTRVLIIELTVDGEPTLLGALADAVEDVVDLDEAQIRPAPKIGTRLRTEFIRGIGQLGDEFVIILDIEKVFSAEDLGQVNEVAQAAAGVAAEGSIGANSANAAAE